MSSGPATPPPAAPEPTPAAPATPAAPTATAPAQRATLETRTLSFNEQVGIWILIILVGVVFGAGTSVTYLFSGSTKAVAKDVTDVQARATLTVGNRLTQQLGGVLGPESAQYLPYIHPGLGREQTMEQATQFLSLVRIAETEHLRPDKTGQEQLVRDFLKFQLGRDLSIGDVLTARKGPQALSAEELGGWLADHRAQENLFATRVLLPAIPLTAATAAQRAFGAGADRVEVDVIELTATGSALIAERLSPGELAAHYEQVKASRFTIPETAVLTVAWFDRLAAASAAAPAIAAAAIDQRYARDREVRFRITTSGTAAVYRQLDDALRDELRRELALEDADRLAKAAAGILSQAVEEQQLAEPGKDPAGFARAASAAGLRLDQISVAAPLRGRIALAQFGSVGVETGLWEQEPGAISVAVQSDAGFWLVARTMQRHPGSFQPFAQVQEQVRSQLAARRAWTELRDAALAMQTAAGSAGPGGLLQVARGETYARWRPQPLSLQPMAVAKRITAPGQTVDQAGIATRSVGSLLVGEPGASAPVALERVETAAHEPPRLRLIQARKLIPAPAPEANAAERLAGQYRNGTVGQHRRTLLNDELMAELAQRRRN